MTMHCIALHCVFSSIHSYQSTYNAVPPSITGPSSAPLPPPRIVTLCVPGCRTESCTVTTYPGIQVPSFSFSPSSSHLPPASRTGADMHLCYLA